MSEFEIPKDATSFYFCETCKDSIRGAKLCNIEDKVYPIVKNRKIWGFCDLGAGGWVDPYYCKKCFLELKRGQNDTVSNSKK